MRKPTISVLCCALLVMLTSCERVRESYDSYEAAASAGLFERGWLPAYIPRSSYAISTRHDLDTNKNQGEFHFDPADLPTFLREVGQVESGKSTEGYVQYARGSFRFWINATTGHAKFRSTPP